MRGWYRDWRRRWALRRHGLSDRDWEAAMQRVPAVARYDTPTRNRLRELVTLFLHEKSIEPAGDLELSDEDRRLIALQACLPILGLGLEWYDGWRSVIVYPGDFMARDRYTDEAGVVHEVEETRAGEAWTQGPVVLSWAPEESPLSETQAPPGPVGVDAVNVVIHEFAHKLDMINGVANGMPPLHADMTRNEWTRAFSRAYDDFVARVERGERLALDEYAATDPGEFFAVASEMFLTAPDRIRDAYPRVYTQLCAFYRQHPHTG